jgi:hypothetical protein
MAPTVADVAGDVDELDLSPLVQRGRVIFQSIVRQGFFQRGPVDTCRRGTSAGTLAGRTSGEIQAAIFQCSIPLSFQQVSPADQFRQSVPPSWAINWRAFATKKVVDDMFRLAVELTQHWASPCGLHPLAGVQGGGSAHHDVQPSTTNGAVAETELVRAQQRTDDHVPLVFIWPSAQI